MHRQLATLASLLLAASAAAQAPTLSWRARYDGPGHRHDVPVQVATGRGCVFVLGTSHSLATNDDFTLLKYTSAGALEWARQYDGRAHAGDRASSVVADDAGGAYVCGHSWTGSADSAVLAHYDADGDLLWVRSVPSPQPIDFERGPRLVRTADGELRMGLTSSGNFLVAAFDGLGAPLWQQELDVVPGELDLLTAIAVDSAGSTIASGPVAGGLGGYVTVKLDRDGAVEWTDTELGELGNTLGPAFVAVGDDDETVVTGTPESTCGLLQTRTWRLASDGSRLWTRSFPRSPCDSALAVDMVLDAEGSALVLCMASSWSSGIPGFSTLKYDRAGNAVWHRRISHPGTDIPVALDVDILGNVYIAGVVGVGAPGSAGMAASYAPDGSLRWIQLFRDETQLAGLRELAVGPDGALYFTGTGGVPGGTWSDILTVKLQEP